MRTEPMLEEHPIEVVFVEDDSDLADMYRLKLELDGYRVTTIRSSEAVDRAGTPDLVFVDLSSDSTRSLEILRRVRARAGQGQLPAVVLARASRAELKARGIDLGPCDYPVRLGPLRSPVDAWPLSA